MGRLKGLGKSAILTMRVFGLANLVMAFWGGYLTYQTVGNYYVISARTSHLDPPAFRPIFIAITSVNLMFLVALVVAGVLLLFVRPSCFALCNIVFGGEIAFLVVQVLLSMIVKPPLSDSLGAAWGVGNMALSPQLLTGYPVIALIVLNLVARASHHPPR
jgi:hypothetical protein